MTNKKKPDRYRSQGVKRLTLLMLLLLTICGAVNAETGLTYVETADGKRSPYTRELTQWTHSRLVFSKDIARVAVGEKEVLEVEILGGRELLVLAKSVGRTSVIIWYPDETTETFLFSVNEDLSVLQRALLEIDPGIRLELTPDRNALVLRGTVATFKVRQAAESAVRNYLNAADEYVDTAAMQDDITGDITPVARSATAIINLLEVAQESLSSEQKIIEAIRSLNGMGEADVTVSRIQRGDVPSANIDTLLLQGQVQNQVVLVRVLTIAARLFLGSNAELDSPDIIEVVADETGALVGQRHDISSGMNGMSAGNIPGLSGSNNSNQLRNEIRSNIGRAKLLSIANGRILSMIEVRDLPQVRVTVQIHEINRTRIKNWRPDLTLVTDGYQANSMSADGNGMVVQPDASQRIGALGSGQVENALQILGGTLSNNFQIGGTDLAFDLLFSLLEKEGISRTLSRPTLTVLAGESAVFQVGGEVPVPSSFAPAGVGVGDTASGSNTPGVFSGTEFRPFGVQLAIRPLVGEDDRITLDIRPTVSAPDAALTQQIASSTGSQLNSTAFSTRSIQTTTRLRDGQPLVIGGLVSRRVNDSENYTPGVHKVPVLGWLAKSSDKLDDDFELVIVVTPTLVREPLDNVGLWQFPPAFDLLGKAVGMPKPEAGSSK